MSVRSQLLHALSHAVVLVFAVAALAPRQEVLAEQNRFSTYDTPTGEVYFALSLSPQAGLPAANKNEVTILFDTSASQTGLYREDALLALRTLLGSLSAEDQVRLVAVDLEMVPLTAGLVAPQGPAIEQALEQLQRRTPLGSTDLAAILQTAADQFSTEHPRSLVYLGDGVSRAGLLNSERFAGLVQNLVKQRVSVSSLVIGPQRDVATLAALANHTGGVYYIDSDQGNAAQQAGVGLAKAVAQPVLWPLEVTLPENFRETYPRTFPPLRTDRDSILIGVLNARAEGELQLRAEYAGQPITQRWSLRPEPASSDFGFLPQLAEMARKDAGATLPTAGSAALRDIASLLTRQADALSDLGTHALNTGDLDGARTAAAAAIARDPSNPFAVALQGAADRASGLDGAPATGAPDLSLTPTPEPRGSGDLLREYEGEAGGFLDTVERTKRVQSQVIQTEVERGLAAAREKMGADPERARTDLKLLLERVDRAPDLDAGVRAELRERIEAVVRVAQSREVVVQSQRADAEENRAAAREALLLLEKTERRQQTVKQLMDRFNTLLDEGKYLQAEQDVAGQAMELAPNSPTPVVAFWNARFLEAVARMEVVRDARHRGFADALFQVEKSAVPFPDEPPIVYPAADIWEQMTYSRKKYAAVDLAGGDAGSAESRITSELDKETSIEALDQALKEVIDNIAFFHDIPIVINSKALEDAGVAIDTPVTKNLKGITLRSALRLLLRDLELTYIIKDEVLQITTPDEAESQLITKVYPVGDLVIPVISGGGGFGMGGGIGGGGFGGGGIGGGMGGGMGGMGGMGGGMGGMGGGGMGGGFFAVEDELSLGVKKPTPASAPKAAQPARPVPGVKPANGKPVGPRTTAANAAQAKKAAEPAAIILPVVAGEDRATAWDRHFAAHRHDSAVQRLEHQRQVRQTVRQLQQQAQLAFARQETPAAHNALQEIVTILQAALRQGQPQPWMYEAISLSLLASGKPVTEAERALMSAVDFTSDSEQILHVAAFMSQLGLDQRALKLYQELALVNPYRPEPYVLGLAAAQRLQDAEGLQWACVGILSQEWSLADREIPKKAFRVAEARWMELKQAGQLEEAEKLSKAVSEAQIRDCVVRVTWTGDADLDLLVEEPGASVCSLQQPRTLGGGVLLGDGFSGSTVSPDGVSETYICPRGFTGEYRMLLRRAWGQVAAGRATVEIWTHYGTPKQTYGKQQIPIGTKDVVVNFEVADGRRVEPIAEEKIANLERVREKMGRQVLAQQFNAFSDPSSARDYALAVYRGMRSGAIDPRIFGRAGAVGYRPQVQVFPEGNQMDSMAVISADRRYVRFTLLGSAPIASGITNVDTFNFVTGDSGGGGGGGGGGGFGGGGGGFGGGGGGGFGGGGVF